MWQLNFKKKKKKKKYRKIRASNVPTNYCKIYRKSIVKS